MAGLRFDQTAFGKFISCLPEDFFSEGNLQTRDSAQDYLEEIIAKNGLPSDKHAEDVILLLIRRISEKRKIKEPLNSYIYGFICDLAKKYQDDWQGLFSVFCSGMDFKEIIDGDERCPGCP